jgi:hypothetical protein
MDVYNLNNVVPFITKDGSEIRELLAYRNKRRHGSCKLIFAKAASPSFSTSCAHVEVPIRV